MKKKKTLKLQGKMEHKGKAREYRSRTNTFTRLCFTEFSFPKFCFHDSANHFSLLLEFAFPCMYLPTQQFIHKVITFYREITDNLKNVASVVYLYHRTKRKVRLQGFAALPQFFRSWQFLILISPVTNSKLKDCIVCINCMVLYAYILIVYPPWSIFRQQSRETQQAQKEILEKNN